MKSTGIAVFVVAQLLCLGSAHGAESDRASFDEERKKQEEIFRSKGAEVPGGYVLDRTLADYVDALAPDFEHALARLGPNDRWMDIGAGRARAIVDYFSPDYDIKYPQGRERRGRKAQAIAMSVEDRRTPLWHQTAAKLGANQMQYLFDRPLRSFSLQEMGKFQIITDLLGGFSYTDELSVFTEKVLSFLELNGTFYTLLQDVNSEAGTNRPFYPNAPYLTELQNADGSETKVCPWLKSISCVEVSCELKPRWKPPIEIYRIQKVCNAVSVPALTRIHYQAGTPPERRYRLQK